MSSCRAQRLPMSRHPAPATPTRAVGARACGWRAAAAALAFALAAPLVHAQRSAADAPAAPASAPAPIALVDLPARAEEDHRIAELASARTTDRDAVAQLEQRLAALGRLVDERLRAQRSEKLRRLPVIRLESLARQWAFEERRFDAWQADMRQTFAPYLEDAARLAARRAEWQATRAAQGSAALPDALADSADAMVDELKAAEQALAPMLARQIELGQRASLVESRIRAGSAEVAAAVAAIDRGLLRIGAPPLWSAQPAGTGGELQSAWVGLDGELRFAREYTQHGPAEHLALGLIQLLLLALLVWLVIRDRTAPLSQRDTGGAAGEGVSSAEASARVLARPVSAWLLLSMLTSIAFGTSAPLIAREAAMLVALVPMLRLLPPSSLLRHGRAPFVAIVALYLLQRVAIALMGSSHLFRLYQLALAVLMLASCVWLLRRRRGSGATPGEPRAPATSRLFAAVAGAIALVACVANIVGNVSLAEMLVAGVIDSSYFALLMHSGVAVALALLAMVQQLPAVARRRWQREHGANLTRLAARTLGIAAFVGWAVYTLDVFRALRPVRAAAEGLLSHAFTFGAVSISLGNVFVFALSVLISIGVARITRLLLRDHLLDRATLPRGVGNSAASLAYYGILLLGFLFALSAAGFEVSQLAIVFGALGVGIGLGLQNIVTNFVAGLVLMFERPIRPGDAVDFEGVSGEVREIGMRATIIRTFDGADVVVPNGTLTASNLTNWTLFDRRRRIEVAIGVAYGSDPQRILPLLVETARQTPGVALEPAPIALFTGYGNSSLDFVLRAWTRDYDRSATVGSDLRTRVLQAMNDAGVEIPFNQLDLNLRGVSDAAGSALRAGEQSGGTTPPARPADAAPT